MSKVAKPYIVVQPFKVSGSYSTGDFVDYLTGSGHQRVDGDEVPFFTKGVTKKAKEYQAVLVDEFQNFEDKFKEVRANKEDHRVRADAEQLGCKFFVTLPNELTEEQTAKVAKALLANVPKKCAAVIGVHELSNKGERSLHLQAFVLLRPGGYGVSRNTEIDAWRRRNAAEIRGVVFDELKKLGYEIHQKQPMKSAATQKQKYIFDRMIEKDAARQVIPEDVARRRSELRTSDSWWLEASKNTELSEQMRNYASEISRNLTRGHAERLARPIRLYEHQESKKDKVDAVKEELSQKLETTLSSSPSAADGRETPQFSHNLTEDELTQLHNRELEISLRDFHNMADSWTAEEIYEALREKMSFPATWKRLSQELLNEGFPSHAEECLKISDQLKRQPKSIDFSTISLLEVEGKLPEIHTGAAVDISHKLKAPPKMKTQAELQAAQNAPVSYAPGEVDDIEAVLRRPQDRFGDAFRETERRDRLTSAAQKNAKRKRESDQKLAKLLYRIEHPKNKENDK
jgi:hypothetical protein